MKINTAGLVVPAIVGLLTVWVIIYLLAPTTHLWHRHDFKRHQSAPNVIAYAP
jgi:hypothetical protein